MSADTDEAPCTKRRRTGRVTRNCVICGKVIRTVRASRCYACIEHRRTGMDEARANRDLLIAWNRATVARPRRRAGALR